MTDEDRPEDENGDAPEDDGAPDLPPPSTFAGKARRAEEEGEEDPNEATGADPADEQEEPPDEFAFDEEEEEPDAGSGSEADDADEPAADEVPDPTVASEKPDAGSGSEASRRAEEPAADKVPDPTVAADGPAGDPKPEVSSVTVEADTLALADIEAQREAAHAGLAARAKKSSFSHEVTTGSHKVQPPAAAPPVAAAVAEAHGEDEGVGAPPKRRIGWRFMAAAFVIVSSMAAATAVSFLLFLSDIAEGLNDSELSAARAQLEKVDGGEPQTILILGSDKRETTVGDPGRSDTAILLRVDPEKEFLSLMSMPRDLVVPIPGFGPEKINAAYTYGEHARRRRWR